VAAPVASDRLANLRDEIVACLAAGDGVRVHDVLKTARTGIITHIGETDLLTLLKIAPDVKHQRSPYPLRERPLAS